MTPLRGIREAAEGVKGFGSTGSCSHCLCAVAAGEKGGEEEGSTEEQKSGPWCEADFVPAAEAEGENIKRQREVYP